MPPCLPVIDLPLVTPRGEAVDMHQVWPGGALGEPVVLLSGSVPCPLALFYTMMASMLHSLISAAHLKSKDDYIAHGSVMVILPGQCLAGWVSVLTSASWLLQLSGETQLTVHCGGLPLPYTPPWAGLSNGLLQQLVGMGMWACLPYEPVGCVPYSVPCHGLPVGQLRLPPWGSMVFLARGEACRWACLPPALFVSPCHGLPVGHLWSPTIWINGFPATFSDDVVHHL